MGLSRYKSCKPIDIVYKILGLSRYESCKPKDIDCYPLRKRANDETNISRLIDELTKQGPSSAPYELLCSLGSERNFIG